MSRHNNSFFKSALKLAKIRLRVTLKTCKALPVSDIETCKAPSKNDIETCEALSDGGHSFGGMHRLYGF
jgi:hypothetical protein